MNENEQCTVWGRDFTLPVVFDCYEGEEVLPEQEAALAAFLEAAPALLDGALARVKAYCLDRDGDLIPEDTIENIFRYVMPRTIYVSRRTDVHEVALMCYYKPDMEAGLAVVFRNEAFSEIGAEYIIL